MSRPAGGRDNPDPNAFVNNGGSWWILVFLMVVAVQAMNLTFRYALGMGFARRDYYVGTVALLFIFVGIAAATMWVRWAAIGLYVFFGSVLVGAVAAVWTITWARAWGSVGDFFTGHSVVVLVSMPLPISVACAVFGYVMMRKATPT